VAPGQRTVVRLIRRSLAACQGLRRWVLRAKNRIEEVAVNTEHERDTMDVGEPEEAELADEEKAEDEMEPLEGGAETIADLDEEAGQTNRPGTERPPV
jgi:hypothetical protein